MNRKRLFTASYAHLSIDIVNSSVAMILTLSAPRFGLDIAQIGFGAMMYQMFAAMSQPIFGGLTDKLRGRWVGALGLLWTLVFFSAASFMPTYPPFIILLMIGGLGSGAFHAAGMVNATVAGGAKANTATSYFFLGGQLGLALGPLIAGIVVGTIGLAGMPLMAAAMLPAVVLMLMWMNDALPEVKKGPAVAKATSEARGMRRHAAVSLLVTAFVLFILLRSGTAQGYATLLPMYFQSLGYAPAQFGFMLSVFSFAGALGTLAGGYLGDRYNRRYIMAFSSMLATPFAFLMLHTGGAAYIAVAIGAGFFLSMPHSLIMVLAQELAPARRGLVGGLTLGFIFASGSGMAWLASLAAEQVGLPLVLNVLAFFPLVAGFIAFLLPASKRARPAPLPVPVLSTPTAAAD